MRNVRNGLAAATVLALGAWIAGGPATAAGAGVGTAAARTTVVAVDLGDEGSLLSVRLLDDEAGTSIDAAKGGPSAHGRLTTVNVTSSAAPALSITPAPAESRQPGGEKQVTKGSVSLAEPYEGVTLDSAVLSGTLGVADLSSDAASSLATSKVSAVLTDASIAGALAEVRGGSSSVEATSASSASEATRSVSVDEVVVLDLGALLEGLDLSLLDLPVSTVVSLLDALEKDVPGVGDATDYDAAVDDLQAQITALAEAPSLPTGTTVGDVVDVINGLGLGELVSPGAEAVIEAADPVGQVNALVDELQAALAALLTEGVQALDDTPLLVAKGAEATLTTKAADTAGNSLADATAAIGGIEVGGIPIDGVDLMDGATVVAETATNVNNALKGALGGIDPGLADLVQVSLFERVSERGVSTSGGYVQAADGLTVLSASVNPPDTLDAIVQAIEDQAGVGEAIAANGGAPPTIASAASMGALESLLGSGVRAAAGGATVRVVEVVGSSDFRVTSQGVGDGSGGGSSGSGSSGGGGGGGGERDRELPRTGSNSLRLAGFATLLIALGLGFREWTRMPVPVAFRAFRPGRRSR